MRRGIAHDGAAGQEAVGGTMRGHLGEDVVQHPVLRALEARHGRGDQPLAAGLLGQGERVVVVGAGHLAVKAQETQLGHGDAHGIGQLRRIGKFRQAMPGQPLRVGLPAFPGSRRCLTGLRPLQGSGDAGAQIAHVRGPLRMPGQRLVVALLGLAALGFLALGQRLLHALLAHLAQCALGVLAHGDLLAQLGQFALQLALALDVGGGQLRLSLALGPEAQALHFLEDDFLFAGGLDALVDLGACGLRLAHAATPARRARPLCGGQRNGATRFSSKSPQGSRDGSCSLDATPRRYACFACGKPLRKTHTVAGVAQ